MELRDWLAIAGLTYGVASDWIGENPKLQANSVAGLLWRQFRRGLNHSKPATASEEVPSALLRSEPNYVKLIEAGFHHRSRLLRMPGVMGVDVGVMGEHLLLTVYREAQKDA